MTPQKAELLGEEIDWAHLRHRPPAASCPPRSAPPCVEPFEGDNGGETSPGVTADEVKVVYYLPDPGARPADRRHRRGRGPTSTRSGGRDHPGLPRPLQPGLRDLRPDVTIEPYTGTGAGDDVEAAKADAIAIAEKEPFAVIGGPARRARSSPAELAARGIVCGSAAWSPPEDIVEEYEPYLWQAWADPRARGWPGRRRPSASSSDRARPSWPATTPTQAKDRLRAGALRQRRRRPRRCSTSVQGGAGGNDIELANDVEFTSTWPGRRRTPAPTSPSS